MAQPRLVVRGGMERNLGTLMEGEKYSKSLVVANTGSDTVHISGIRTSCGCTIAQAKNEAIPPHDSTDLEVTINTKDFIDGPIKKDVYFESDDTTNSKVDVTFHLEIISLIQFIPHYVNFSNLPFGRSSIQKVVVKNNSDTALTIDSIKVKDKRLSATGFKPFRLSPKSSKSISLTLKGSSAGNVLGQFDVFTSYPGKEKVNLSYIGYVKDRIGQRKHR